MNVLGVLWYIVCMFVNPMSVYFYQGTAQKAEGNNGEKSPENVTTDKTEETCRAKKLILIMMQKLKMR